MSIQEERELSERLGDLLGGVDPRPAPVDMVVRRGRGIKRRRYAAVAAGLAVVVAGAVLGPTVIRSQLSAPPPAAPKHYYVTVSPPAKGAKPGVIATGSINGWHWQATLSGSGKDLAAGFGSGSSILALAEPSMADGSLADFESSGDSAMRTSYVGEVAASARYYTVTLSNGQLLTLRPHTWAGHRYVAMVLPEALQVIRADAYGADGVIGSAVPFNFRGAALFQTWLRPGQAGSPQATARIGAGGSGRSRWTATAYLGPWGLCGEVSEQGGWDGFCMPTGTLTQFGLTSGQFGSGPGSVEVAVARPDVAYLIVTGPGGSTSRLEVTHLAGYVYGLLARIRPAHPAPLSWVAYDAHGRRLGSGHGDPAGFH